MGLEDLSDLIERFYNSLGYTTKFLEDGLLEISPPVDKSNLIEISDKDLIITKPTKLAFNLKVSRSHKIELITFESPTLNKIIEYIEKLGKIGKAYIPFTLPEKGNIIDYLKKSGTKINIKKTYYNFLDLEINYSPFIVFDFLISFKSLEKNEILDTQIIPVHESDRNDAYINFIMDQLTEKYPFFSETPPYPGKMLKMDEGQLRSIYLHALQRAELSVQEKEGQFNQRIDKRLKKEIDLLNTYYDSREKEIIKDIERKKKLQEDEYKSDEYRANKLKQIDQLEIDLKRFKNERDRKLKELKSTYGTETEYHLESVGILYSPIDVLLNFKIDSQYGSFNAGLQYDYTHQILFPFQCKCGNILVNLDLNVCSRLHLCCDECLGNCHTCSDYLCKSCGKYCEECDELYCEKHVRDHFNVCEICNTLVCKGKLKACHSCGKKACQYQCLAKCITCHKDFCIECIDRCEICNQPTCSSHNFTCAKCNSHVCEEHYQECATCGSEYCSSCMAGCRICKRFPSDVDKFNAVYCSECRITCEDCDGLFCQEHAHYCAKCAKAICNDHAIQCKGCKEYFCDECLMECERCHAPICSNCVKTCAISDGKFCHEHAVQCSDCNRTIDEKYIKTCSCGKPVCPDCSLKCDICKKILCKNCSSVCEICSNTLCSEHVHECQLCGTLSCIHVFRKKLTKKSHTYKCSIGNELICKNCLRTCSICNSEVCTKHIYRCSKCHEQSRDNEMLEFICENCMRKCEVCGKILCIHHKVGCYNCTGFFCEEHVKKCQICLNNSCLKDFKICSTCGQESCKQHFHGSECITCEVMETLPELNINIEDDRFIDDIKQIYDWKFGTNPSYKVYKGSTSKYRIIIVIKNNGEQEIFKQSTIWGKISSPFSKLWQRLKKKE